MKEIDRLKKIFEEHQSCCCDRAGEMVMTFDDFKLAFAELRALSLFGVSHSLPAEVEGFLHNIRFDETDNLKKDAEYLWSRYCG